MNFFIASTLSLLLLKASGQEVIGSSGESFSTGSATVEFTLGETTIGLLGETSINQGFHQVLIVEPLSTNDMQGLGVTVFPNPMVNRLNVEFNGETDISYAIIDLTGKRLMDGHLRKSDQSIDVSVLDEGSFRIILHNNETNTHKSFLIIKRN